jgi:quercetin dioxygenase-like cupin family protein
METKIGRSPYALDEGAGRATWFAGALLVHKAGAESTDGRFDLLDQTMPPGYVVPRHIHHAEDEAWYVLEGDMTFYCGDQVLSATKGSWIFAPREIAHTFKVGSAGARALTFAAPSGFASFVDDLGEPAGNRGLPPPGPIDEARLVESARKYQVEIVGPPPA